MKKLTKYNIASILFIGISFPVFSFQIELRDWEVNVDGTWKKTAPIYWEASSASGGIGVNHNGYGRYRTSFYLPKKSGHNNLAFYTQCLDDADMAFLNGKFIGKTGKMPALHSKKPIDDMRSGVREARLYTIPQTFLNGQANKPNVLEIVVYDLVGTGGFCFEQTPVIGDFTLYQNRYISSRLLNDVPRWIVIAMLSVVLCVCIVCIYTLLGKYRIRKSGILAAYFRSWMGGILRLSRGTLRISTEDAADESSDQIVAEKIYRLFSLLMTSFMVAIFLLSEIPSKYNLIASERFWYQFPPLAFFIAVYFSQSVFHCEAFGSGLKNRGLLSKTLFILGHPYWYLPMMVFLLFSSPENSWGFFVTAGLAYALVVQVVLGISVFIQLVQYVFFRLKWNQEKVFLRPVRMQMYLRFLALLCMSVGIYLFYSRGALFNNSVLVMGPFYNLTLIISTYFFVRYDIKLPLYGNLVPATVTAEYDQKLKTFKLTNTEILICRELRTGSKRSNLRKLLGISESALKNHLKSIYSKTLGEESPSTGGRDKLQRLTIFLMRID